MKVEAAAATDVGLVRDLNEDSYLLETPLYVVADGMGGHLGGEVASKIAIDTLQDRFADGGADAVPSAVAEANEAIRERGRTDAAVTGMGTTLTAAVLSGTTLALTHVGDSRMYLWRDGELTQLTEDHTLVGEMVKEGSLTEEQARNHPRRSILIRALGIEPDVAIDRLDLPLRDQDRILLCSDGLNSMITDNAIAEVLAGERSPAAACDRLIGAAREAGGADNTTVIVIDVSADPGDVIDESAETAEPTAGSPSFLDRLLRRKT